VVIIAKSAINEFCEVHIESITPLLTWYRKTKKAGWANFNDLKKDYPSADYVGNDLYIFNIKGNKYRLIARIFFSIRTVFIRFIGTHREYDEVDVRNL
jgi:mRNA interferase HigB